MFVDIHCAWTGLAQIWVSEIPSQLTIERINSFVLLDAIGQGLKELFIQPSTGLYMNVCKILASFATTPCIDFSAWVAACKRITDHFNLCYAVALLLLREHTFVAYFMRDIFLWLVHFYQVKTLFSFICQDNRSSVTFCKIQA